MNTGEARATFFFYAVNLPADWTMPPAPRPLCAGEESFARVTVTPDANAAVGRSTITISGFSGTVGTDAPLSVEVVLRSSKLGLGGLLGVALTNTAPTFQVR